MAQFDPKEVSLFGANWKIMIPIWIVTAFILAFVISLIWQASTLSVFLRLLVLAPIFDLMQRIFSFVVSGR